MSSAAPARGLAIAIGLALALLAAPAAAQGTVDPPVAESYETGRGLALGLGGRASAASTSALQYNAAGLTIGRLYHIESVVGYEPGTTHFTIGAAVIDSFSSPIAMGLSYRYILGNGQYGHGGMEGRVAVAVPIGDVFSIGVTGRYTSFWREGQPEGDTRGPFAEGANIDASVRVSPIPGLHIAALGYNFIDYGSPLVPRLVGGSISYTIDNIVMLAFDGLADLSTFHFADGSLRPEALFGGAVEVFISGIPIRAGYSFDTGRDIHYITAGLGYVHEQFGVEISWRQQIVGDDDTWLLASFRYFIH
jgi:hypothetical protein